MSLSAHAFLHVSGLAATVVVVALLRYQNVVGLLYGLLIAMYGVIYIPLKVGSGVQIGLIWRAAARGVLPRTGRLGEAAVW